MPDRSKGRGQAKSDTWSSRLGLGVGPTAPCCKTTFVTESSTDTIPTIEFQVDLSQPHGNMITSVESLTKEGRGVKDSLFGPKAKIRIEL